MTSENSDASENNSAKRRGFPPLLIAATLAVIFFTLWFCPRAFHWAAKKSAARSADNLDQYLPSP